MPATVTNGVDQLGTGFVPGAVELIDPLALARELWPNVRFYKQQQELIYSVWYNDETICPAGNMLGKDFTAAFIVLAFFLTREPCRIVTTSAKDDHLRVLWGEINRFIQTCKVPLDCKQGGPLSIKHHDIRREVNGKRCPLSYLVGMVASDDSIAAMQGHHIANTGDGIPRTLFVADESSSVSDSYYKMARTWCNRLLAIGNPWPCNNFFKKAVKGDPETNTPGGDLPNPDKPNTYYRKVIRIKAADSPNVRYGLAQARQGIKPTDAILIEGVKSYGEYTKNLKLWDKIQICVSIDADFYEGAEVLLYPPEWLNRAEAIAKSLKGRHRVAKALGIDPGEGGANTAMCVIDELGIIELASKKTPSTDMVWKEALAMMQKYNIPANKVGFDRGGGGKQHADMLRSMGHAVRTVSFGEPLSLQPKRGLRLVGERIEQREEQYTYLNRRAEMYHDIRQLLDPCNEQGFGIPQEYTELRRQLAPIPLTYDGEGRLYLLPKNAGKVGGANGMPGSNSGKKVACLTDLIGCSPDEADSLAIAIHMMLDRNKPNTAGPI